MPKLDHSATVIRDLHPVARPLFERLADNLEKAWSDEKTHSLFRPFQGLRTPIQQLELLNRRPPVTHVGPWNSAHQYGLAVDFVPWKGDAWSWSEDHDYQFLRLAAEAVGLRRPMEWDKCHIEHPCWDELHATLKKYEKKDWLAVAAKRGTGQG